MANPLSVILGGPSAGHTAREAEIAKATEAQVAQSQTPPPTPQALPQQAPVNPATGKPSFLSSVATTPPNTGNLAGKTLLGQ